MRTHTTRSATVGGPFAPMASTSRSAGRAGSSFSTIFVGGLLSLLTDRYSGLMLWWRVFDRDDAATLARMVADGSIRPAIDRRFPLVDTVDALRHVDDGLARGKVIVTVP